MRKERDVWILPCSPAALVKGPLSAVIPCLSCLIYVHVLHNTLQSVLSTEAAYEAATSEWSFRVERHLSSSKSHNQHLNIVFAGYECQCDIIITSEAKEFLGGIGCRSCARVDAHTRVCVQHAQAQRKHQRGHRHNCVQIYSLNLDALIDTSWLITWKINSITPRFQLAQMGNLV